MITLIISVIVGIMLAAFVGYMSRNEKYPDFNIDDARIQMKEDGLALHIPSYRDGIEAYVPEKFQYNKLPANQLKRI